LAVVKVFGVYALKMNLKFIIVQLRILGHAMVLCSPLRDQVVSKTPFCSIGAVRLSSLRWYRQNRLCKSNEIAAQHLLIYRVSSTSIPIPFQKLDTSQLRRKELQHQHHQNKDIPHVVLLLLSSRIQAPSSISSAHSSGAWD